MASENGKPLLERSFQIDTGPEADSRSMEAIRTAKRFIETLTLPPVITIHADLEKTKSGDTFLMEIDGEWYKARKIRKKRRKHNERIYR